MLSSTTPRLGADVAAGHRDALDQAVADLLGELRELVAAETLQVGGALDGGEKGHGRLVHR